MTTNAEEFALLYYERDIQLEILRELRHISHQLSKLVDDENPNRVVRFTITQENHMAILGVVPGATGSFTATPLNAESVAVALPLSTVPVWTSDDTTNAPVVASADGLSATVAVPASFVPAPGASFNLTVTMADGSASTTANVPYDAVPVDNTVASFGINQTS